MVLALAACKDEKKDAEAVKPVIKIGGILPMTGGAAHIGEGARNGAIMAVETLNSDLNNKYKYVNKSGKIITSKEYDLASDFTKWQSSLFIVSAKLLSV